MSSNLHKFTVEEALNAQSIHSGKWIVHPMRTWVDKDPNNVKTTGFLDVSDTTLISVQCGDFMCISFQKGPGWIVDGVQADGNFDIDVAAGSDGTYWKTGNHWTISGGKAVCDRTGGGSGGLLQQRRASDGNWDLTTNSSYQITYTVCDYESGGLHIRAGWDNEDGDTEICRSPKRNGNGIYTDFLTAVDANLYISADVGSKFSLENIKVRELTQINKSTDFALYPGQHQIQIPKGLGDDIIFSYLPYTNPTFKGPLFMRIVEH